jgi:NADPH-dependent ferric siderophore reductase
MSQSIAPPADNIDTRLPRRVRHETKRRRLQVIGVDKISKHMVRVSLGSPELDGFTSLGFDDHVKLFFPQTDAGQIGPDGQSAPASRDYTPRRYDPTTNTLVIDFALHEAGGPATRWAEQVQTGQHLEIGGPRGSFIIPEAYDWHLMIGDETALPAIGRRLGELSAGARAVVIAEVDGAADEISFETAADVSITWAHRNGAKLGSTDVLSRALTKLRLPGGDYYAWVACESLIAKALRAQLIAEYGANPKWMRAAGYWRRGAVATHDTFND